MHLNWVHLFSSLLPFEYSCFPSKLGKNLSISAHIPKIQNNWLQVGLKAIISGSEQATCSQTNLEDPTHTRSKHDLNNFFSENFGLNRFQLKTPPKIFLKYVISISRLNNIDFIYAPMVDSHQEIPSKIPKKILSQRAQWDICLPRGKNCRGTIFAPVLPLNYLHHEGILGAIWGTTFYPEIAYFQGPNHLKGQLKGQFKGQFQRAEDRDKNCLGRMGRLFFEIACFTVHSVRPTPLKLGGENIHPQISEVWADKSKRGPTQKCWRFPLGNPTEKATASKLF